MNARLMDGVDGLGYARPQLPACPPFCVRHDVHEAVGDAYHYGTEVGVPLSSPSASLSMGVTACRDDRDGRAEAPYVYLFHSEDFGVELTAEQARQLGLALIDASVDVAVATRGGAR